MWEEWSNKGDQLNGNTGKKREEKEDRGMRSSKQQSYFGSPRSHQGWWWWFSTKSCPTFAAPWTVYSLPGSSVHGILQARIQEWAPTSFSRGSSPPRDRTWVYLHCRQILYHLSYHGSPPLEGFKIGNSCTLWLIHVNVWQSQFSIAKQNKVKIKK